MTEVSFMNNKPGKPQTPPLLASKNAGLLAVVTKHCLWSGRIRCGSQAPAQEGGVWSLAVQHAVTTTNTTSAFDVPPCWTPRSQNARIQGGRVVYIWLFRGFAPLKSLGVSSLLIRRFLQTVDLLKGERQLLCRNACRREQARLG
jgi:hypothetical protein